MWSGLSLLHHFLLPSLPKYDALTYCPYCSSATSLRTAVIKKKIMDTRASLPRLGPDSTIFWFFHLGKVYEYWFMYV